MNKKYERYINYIVNDIEKPYFINMRDNYGLRPDEYKLILDKVFNQPVTIKGNDVYDQYGKQIYLEYIDGFWYKTEYDDNGNETYYENSDGGWVKWEYDENGNEIYYENSDGYWEKREYDENDNEIYYEDSDGDTIDDR